MNTSYMSAGPNNVKWESMLLYESAFTLAG